MIRRLMLLAALFVGVVLTPHFPSMISDHSSLAFAAEKIEQTVIFNTKTHKYHSASCKWAIKCTKNCIAITLSEAIRRGGAACKICGGR